MTDTSMYYDDLHIGLVLTSLGRTVTETDLVTFSMLSGDWNPIHADENFARGTDYGQRVVHGLLGLSILTGLMDHAGWFATSAVGMLDIKDWQFTHPLFVGDTLHCELEISHMRLTSRGDRGIVGRSFRLRNELDEIVQQGQIPMMIRVREPGFARTPG